MTITPTTISDAYDAIGYWDDSAGVRIAGSADAGTVNMSYFGTDTVDRGATDNILMPECRIINHNLTLQGRLAISGTGGSTILADLSGSGKFDTKGYGTLPVALRPSSGPLHNTVLRASALIDGIQFIDSGTPAGNMFVWQIISTDQPSALLLNSVSAIGALDDCFSMKASTSLLGTNAEGSLVITIGCTASDPGSATNNQAFTSHDAIRVFGWNNTYSGNNSGGSDIAVSHVNDGTLAYEYNLTANGKVGGLTGWYGGTVDCRGLLSVLSFNDDYDADTVWQDITVSNWATGLAQDAIRLNHPSSTSLHTFRRILFDGGGSLFRCNSAATGTYLIDKCATVFGKTDTDRVLTDSGATLTLRLTDNALRCSGYSIGNSGGITVSEDTGNVYQNQGSGYTHPTPANTIATPSEAQVNATGAGSVLYPVPSIAPSSFRSADLATLIAMSDPNDVRMFLSASSGTFTPAVGASILPSIK